MLFSGNFSGRIHFKRMRVGTVGTAHITPPLPKNQKPGLVPGFFVGEISQVDGCFTPNADKRGRSQNQ